MIPLIIFLGATGSGRAAAIKELTTNAWPEGKKIRVLHEKGEATTEGDSWSFQKGEATIPQPGQEDAAILVTNGKASQVDQMEAIHRALSTARWQCQRILTVVDCPLASRHHELNEWYKASIHFSDVVILNRRWEVPGQWMSKFLEPYTDDFYPCLFINLLKNGTLPNPAAAIEGEPLRLSHIFDDIDAVDEMEFDEDNLPDEPFDLVRQPDPYFARDELGRRKISLPDISEILKSEGR